MPQKKFTPIPRGSYDPLMSSHLCPVPRASVQFPRATVQFPRDTVQFLALLSSSSRFCPVLRAIVQFPRATVQSLFFFLGFPKAGYIFVFLFPSIRLSILLYQYTVNLFQYFGPIHTIPFDFLALLSSSSSYCPFPRATVQFLALLSSSSNFCPVPRAIVQFLLLLCSSSRYCPVCSHCTIARGDMTVARGDWTVARGDYPYYLSYLSNYNELRFYDVLPKVHVNLPAVKRRADTLGTKRTVKQQWQVQNSPEYFLPKLK